MRVVPEDYALLPGLPGDAISSGGDTTGAPKTRARHLDRVCCKGQVLDASMHMSESMSLGIHPVFYHHPQTLSMPLPMPSSNRHEKPYKVKFKNNEVHGYNEQVQFGVGRRVCVGLRTAPIVPACARTCAHVGTLAGVGAVVNQDACCYR